ncbi:MAG: ubiquinone/menaquinone biosynthesis methyltransferase [Planctomycetes bacterium]|nr:ubiquinone/menaquinone biosynthesis methyltransferase [Planctomycetota bacterium]
MSTDVEVRARAAKSPRAIAEMFGDIAPRYDLANSLLSAGLHHSWRCAAAADLVAASRRAGEGAPRRWLDVCGGTADFALADLRAAGPGAGVVCTDFSAPMLRVAKDKLRRRDPAGRIDLAQADALRLPFRPGALDALTIAFGIRNVADPRRALGEFARVLRPGGWCGVLEFGLPVLPAARALYGLYFNRVLPRLGGSIARGRRGNAYAYFRDSVHTFPCGDAFAEFMRTAGFGPVSATPFLFGIVWWYLGRRR